MESAENDLKQLKQCRGILASVYRTQTTNEILDNAHLSEINNAILSVNNVIRLFEEHKGKE